MKKIFIITGLFIIFLNLHITAYAAENIPSDLSQIDLSPIDTVIKKSAPAFSIDAADLFKKAIAGQIDLSPDKIIKGLIKTVFYELFENAALLRNMLVLAIASAIIKTLTDSFESKSVGEAGFYISYIAIVAALFSSFRVAADVLTGLCETVTFFMQSATPVFISLMVMNGNLSGAYVFNSLMLFAVNFVNRLVSFVIAPAIISASALNIINYVAEADILTNLARLFKNTLSWCLKVMAMGFVSIISIQKISTPLINSVLMKTAKSAVNAVPVVGGVLSGAMENVMYWAKATKSGVLVVIIIAMVSICLSPIIKLAAISFIYKLAAALIQPVCDKRIVECVDAAGDFTGLLLSCGALLSFMFLVSVIIILSF